MITDSGTNSSGQPKFQETYQDKDDKPWWGDFNPLSGDLVGLPDDRPPRHEEIVETVRNLEEAAISCCFIGEYALTYYGAGRVQNLRSSLI